MVLLFAIITLVLVLGLVATQLKLPQLQDLEVTTADGQRHVCPYAGPVAVTLQNRRCFVGALVFGDELLLGAVPTEDLAHPPCELSR